MPPLNIVLSSKRENVLVQADRQTSIQCLQKAGYEISAESRDYELSESKDVKQ